jgi:hypothetical protein
MLALSQLPDDILFIFTIDYGIKADESVLVMESEEAIGVVDCISMSILGVKGDSFIRDTVLA